tara:strand:+ start:256 stop:474 length:219 start_codon:yes stop_codon:yes gene_type:complete
LVLTGFDEGAMAYDIQRAHSADIWFIKFRAYFWGTCAALSTLLIGNILGVFDINIMGWMLNISKDTWNHIFG